MEFFLTRFLFSSLRRLQFFVTGCEPTRDSLTVWNRCRRGRFLNVACRRSKFKRTIRRNDFRCNRGSWRHLRLSNVWHYGGMKIPSLDDVLRLKLLEEL